VLHSSSASVINNDVIRDLQLFLTYQGQPGLISIVQRTVTNAGAQVLATRLATPLVEINQLVARQVAIKKIKEDAKLLDQLCSALREYAYYEKTIIALDSPIDPLIKAVLGNFHFKMAAMRWLNNYPVGIELGQAAHMATLSLPLLEHLFFHYLMNKIIGEHTHTHECGHHHGHNHSPEHAQEHGEHHEPCNQDHGAENTPALPSKMQAVVTALLGTTKTEIFHTLAHGAVYVWSIKGLVDVVRQESAIVQEMQKQLIEVRKALAAAQHTSALLEAHQLLTADEGLAGLKSLANSHDSTHSAELQEFLTLIYSPTFSGDASFFSRPGVIVRAYALSKKVYSELRTKLAAVAHADFYVSCAILFNEYAMSATPFTFAHYAADSKPAFTIRGVWNPLMKQAQSIDHTIELGGLHNPRIAVITGPNKAGKSTTLAATASTVLLAQTLGMVPAQECTLTPFAKIKTAFNMNSRVREGSSLFTTSLDFAQSVIKEMRNDPRAFIFVAVDELFNSTEFMKGSAIAAEFLQALGEGPNALGAMVTHFSTLTVWEDSNPTIYKNFKADLTEKDGVYTLVPGVSDTQQVLRHVPTRGMLNNL
jgi:hypothetical protein